VIGLRRRRAGGAESNGARAQTVALCMIVRNEAHVLERCLRSLDGLIDAWTICDTGSSDGTAELARSLLGHLPGELHHRPWVDFGHNRSELLELARGTADYLLLLDADMTVRREGELPQLVADAYLLRETGALDFGVVRLVRGDRRWWYEGSTHEYIATDGELLQEELDVLAVEHHGDGSSRAEKLVRDAGLLKRDMLADPANPRPVFYLAQTYRDLGKHELAAKYYRRRVELGGWEEEAFYANLQEGSLTVRRDLAAGVPILLEAWQRRPSRAEPLFELAQAYRERGDFALARMFAERGLQVPYPADLLFIHRWIYDYGLLMERAFAAGGLGDVEQTRADLSTILEYAELPEETRSYVEQSLEQLGGGPQIFDASAAPDVALSEIDRPPAGAPSRIDTAPARQRITGPVRLASLVPGVRIGEIKLDVKPAWPAFNPSIARDLEDGFKMIVRTANYAIERGVLHAEGVLHNLNYLVTLDDSLAVTQIEPLLDRAERPQVHASQISGYEDCRLVELDGRWHATATVCDMNPVERREIALLSFDGAEIVRAQPLAGPDPERHEKNWMPFVRDGALHFLYSCSPTIVLRCELDSGAVTNVAERELPAAGGFRGGSQGVAVDGGHLFVIHQTEHEERALRYVHRFVLLDDELRLAAATPRFTFTADRVEFCAGMALRGGDLVLSFGVSDAAAGLAVLALEDVLTLLEPLATSQPVG
jgi:glycosyltransferase involved in cell wall biosynthesis/predicted GH43/DUF377 family glycosyl hydrolase